LAATGSAKLRQVVHADDDEGVADAKHLEAGDDRLSPVISSELS
jgi:hypothetical protein